MRGGAICLHVLATVASVRFVATSPHLPALRPLQANGRNQASFPFDWPVKVLSTTRQQREGTPQTFPCPQLPSLPVLLLHLCDVMIHAEYEVQQRTEALQAAGPSSLGKLPGDAPVVPCLFTPVSPLLRILLARVYDSRWGATSCHCWSIRQPAVESRQSSKRGRQHKLPSQVIWQLPPQPITR